MNELKSRIKTMIVERLFLSVEPSSIADDAPLMETFGVDSVSLFELVVGLEDEFGVSLDDSNFSPEMFRDVNSIAELVNSKA